MITGNSSIKNPKGMGARNKFLFQSISGLAVAIFLYQTAKIPAETELLVPLFKDVAIPLGWGFIVLTYLVVVGTSNAVNLTDGLDGLAIYAHCNGCRGFRGICLYQRELEFF